MRRRQFVALVGSAAAQPSLTWAQAAMPLIGFMSSRSPSESARVVTAFRQGLAEAGFAEGRNVAIAFRWAEGRYHELPKLAAELVELRVAVLFAAGGTPAARAAKEATSAIPVVFSAAPDPVGFGLVASLHRPGGNITGMATLTSELGAKSVEVVKDLLPKASVIGYLLNPSNPSAEAEAEGGRAAARVLGVELRFLPARTERELDVIFSALTGQRVDALVVSPDPFFDSRRDRLVALAEQLAIPAKYGWREYVVAGGLMSYGTNLPDSYRRAGVYVGRILRGEKPAELPVMQPDKFELVLNAKTAKALGIEISPRLFERADEVIE